MFHINQAEGKTNPIFAIIMPENIQTLFSWKVVMSVSTIAHMELNSWTFSQELFIQHQSLFLG